eukprot:4209653-Alexandrium_andersonii.AAC.1
MQAAACEAPEDGCACIVWEAAGTGALGAAGRGSGGRSPASSPRGARPGGGAASSAAGAVAWRTAGSGVCRCGPAS